MHVLPTEKQKCGVRVGDTTDKFDFMRYQEYSINSNNLVIILLGTEWASHVFFINYLKISTILRFTSPLTSPGSKEKLNNYFTYLDRESKGVIVNNRVN